MSITRLVPFTALKDSEQRAETRTKRLMIPAALVAKAVEVLALYAVWH